MTKILLKFSDKQVDRPVTSQIILDLGVQLNILNATVTSKGGESLVDVAPQDVDRVAQAFKEKGVIVAIQRGIEVDTDKCIECGACYSLCPVDAISFKEAYSIVFDEATCISCGLCVDTCPTRAIRI